MAVETGSAFSGLDPLTMLDLGTYGVVSQSFEYLVGLGVDGFIGPTGLASAWSPNELGDVWTFTLREGVFWQDGLPFTSADVAATLDRAARGGFSVDGVLVEGAVETPDDLLSLIHI